MNDIEESLRDFSPGMSLSGTPGGSFVYAEFDAHTAFISGLAGIGGAGLLASTVAATAGIGLGTTIAILALPLLAVGAVVSAIVWAVMGKSWQERLARKVADKLLEAGVEQKLSEGVNKLWDETHQTYTRALSVVEQRYQDYRKRLREIVTTERGIQWLEARIEEAKQARSFFESLPWNGP